MEHCNFIKLTTKQCVITWVQRNIADTEFDLFCINGFTGVDDDEENQELNDLLKSR